MQSVPLGRGQRGDRSGGGDPSVRRGPAGSHTSDGRWECLGLPSPSLCHNLCWCHHQRNEPQRLGQAWPPWELWH